MCANKLKLNDSKTEFFIAASDYYQRQLPDINLTIGDSCIKPSQTIRNLRAFFDSNISQTSVAQLNFTTCNGLLSSVPKSHILRLQRLQNWAARIIFIVDRRHESSPLLKSLHWLPVKQRITYKLLLYVYKALNGLAPMYISNCLKLYVPKRNLRSSSDCLRLDYPITRNKAGDRTFTFYASKLWNNLPMTLRNCTSVNAFKKALKTHLFPN